MQRSLRITLAVTGATGALLLGAGTASAAEGPIAWLFGDDNNQSAPNTVQVHRGQDGADASSSDSNSTIVRGENGRPGHVTSSSDRRHHDDSDSDGSDHHDSDDDD